MTALVERMSVAPARLLSLRGKGSLAPGMDADLTVIDPEVDWVIEAAAFRSKSRNTPFDGWRVKGRTRLTIVDGRVVFAT